MSLVSLKEIVAGRRLSVAESRELMLAIASGRYTETYLAALLTALATRGLDVDLLDGFSSAAAELATPIDLDCAELIDMCGTGGDGKSSFNISTTAAFVVAGAGYKVAKHGNIAVSSSCGSSNVLEALGIKLSGEQEHLKRSLAEAGVCFIHAPLFNQAFRSLAPVRKELGFRTVFNALGPLINPATIDFQYTGVYNLELQRLYGYLLNRRNKKFAVVHSLDGYDELSLTDTARVVSSSGSFELRPGDLSSPKLSPAQIAAPTSAIESAKLIEGILKNSSVRALKSCVVANAGSAIWFYQGARGNLSECLAIAEESINSGRALKVLRRCQEL